ncbi:hypothetical protein ACFV4P_11330 [Kitasatospora sp. NPDC059795]|uniref:hypothetical protein n=1 Tax=Kitasatospora sp. NPDC059795 TaxID=3346949 RepID=UPI0036545A9F
MLQRILSGWHELALPLPDLEQHLAEQTDYIVHVHHAGLPQSANRIAKYLAEDHAQPAAAIGHLYDWLTDTMGAQLRGDWVAFLGRAQDARGLTTDQRADFVAIAEVLCFPPQPPEHATGLELLRLAEQALAGGTPSLLLLELDRVEGVLGQQAREAVERSRAYVVRVPPLPHRLRTPLAVAGALLATAGVVAAVVLVKAPPPLPSRPVTWSPIVVHEGSMSSAKVDVPAEAHRLVAHIHLTDPYPGTGGCPGMRVALATDMGQSTDWQSPDVPLSVAVTPGHNQLTLTLALQGTKGCDLRIDTQSVDFER